MSEKELAEMLKYSSSKELYVVTWQNTIMCLYCPFEVRVKRSIEFLRKGQIVKVDELKITLELKMVYIIKSKAYYYFYFDIIIDD